jgi:hypothetical protein
LETVEEPQAASIDTAPLSEAEQFAADLRAQLADADTESVGNIFAGAMAEIEAIEETLTKPRMTAAVTKQIIMERTDAAGATDVIHPLLEGGFTTKTTTTYIEAEIVKLANIEINGMRIPDEEVEKAVRLEEIPAQVIVKTHGTYIKQLGKKYGKVVQEIIDKAAIKNTVRSFALWPRGKK